MWQAMALGQKGRLMRRREFISLKVYVIVGWFAAITPADLAP